MKTTEIRDLIRRLNELETEQALLTLDQGFLARHRSLATRTEIEHQTRDVLAQIGAAVVDHLGYEGVLALVDDPHDDGPEPSDAVGDNKEAPDPGPADPTLSAPDVHAAGPVVIEPEPAVEAEPPAPPTAVTTPGQAVKAKAEAPAKPARAPAPARPASAELTPDIAAKLMAAMQGNTFERAAGAVAEAAALAARQEAAAAQVVRRLGPTPRLERKAHIDRELARLLTLKSTDFDEWSDVSPDFYRAVVGWVAARARALQGAAETHPGYPDKGRLDSLFNALSKHSKKKRLGFIHGLALTHEPKSNSWTQDALEFETRLHGMFEPEAPAGAGDGSNADDAIRRLEEAAHGGSSPIELKLVLADALAAGVSERHPRLVGALRERVTELTEPGYAGLRRAIETTNEREEEAQAPLSKGIPEDWPLRDRVRGARVVLIGGDARAQNVKSLKQAFGFAECLWESKTAEGTRHVDGLEQQMTAGSIDFVIVLQRFVSHSISDRVFRAETPTCRVILAETYSTVSVRRAFERFLAAH
jgi:hypothetical protein